MGGPGSKSTFPHSGTGPCAGCHRELGNSKGCPGRLAIRASTVSPGVAVRSRTRLTCNWMPPPGGGSSGGGGKSPSMVGSTASIRRVAAMWASHSVVLTAAAATSCPAVAEEAILNCLPVKVLPLLSLHLGRGQGRRYRCGSCPTEAMDIGHGMAATHWVQPL